MQMVVDVAQGIAIMVIGIVVLRHLIRHGW